MNTSLALIAAKALPALSGSSLTYNAEKNVYLTLGYTSAAGNTYYRAIRLSDRLAVYYHIGQGYAHTFLNGINAVCMERTEGKHHCSEVLGRMQLAMFQRTKRQGREHPHAEGLPEGTSQGNGQHGGRESAP